MPTPTSTLEGTIARIFVSSTFRDMQSERHLLQTQVLPALRSRCRHYARPVDVVGIDLRWGLTEQQTMAAGAVKLCLDEIGRCPFFLGFLGHRYGWVPGPGEWAADDVSITALEIERGALSNGDRAVIYIRQDDVTLDERFPASLRDVISEPDPHLRRRLDQLRDEVVRRLGPGRVRSYQARYAALRLERAFWPARTSSADDVALADGGLIQPEEWDNLSDALRTAVEAHGLVHLQLRSSDGGDLVQALEADLGRLLDQAYADRPALPTATSGLASQRHFIEGRTRLVVGRDDLIDRLMGRLASESSRVVALTGLPGSGKSTVLASLLERLDREPQRLAVVPFFIGSAPGSTAVLRVIRDLLDRLKSACALSQAIPSDPAELYAALPGFLGEAASKRRVVLLIDALDQLEDPHAADELYWLPLHPPAGTHLVVTTLAGPRLERLRRAGALVETVGGLGPEARTRLIEERLRIRGQSLDPSTCRRLVESDRQELGLPLYLAVALEELALAGSPEAAEATLRSLPSTALELFRGVVQRLTCDQSSEGPAPSPSFGELARHALGFLAASRAGLGEGELVAVLEGLGLNVPMAHLRRLLHSLAPYLTADGERRQGSQEELIDFGHGQLREAVVMEMAGHGDAQARREDVRSYHRRLAEYFEERQRDVDGWRVDARAAGELPHHLLGAGDRARFRALLLDPGWLAAKLEAMDAGAILDDFELLADSSAAMELARGALRLGAKGLARHRAELRSQLSGRLMKSDDSDLYAVRRGGPEPSREPWLLPRTASLTQAGSANELIFGAHEQPVRAVAVADNGRHVASGGAQDDLFVWDADRAVLLRRWIAHRGGTLALAFDGEHLLSAGNDGQLRVWDPFTGQSLRAPLNHGHRASVSCLAIAKDARLLVAGAYDGEISVWSLDTWACKARLAHGPQGVNALAVSPDGRAIASGSYDGSVVLWDRQGAGQKFLLGSHARAVRALAMTADRKLLASGGEDGRLLLWDLSTRSLRKELHGHRDEVWALCLSREDRQLFSGGCDRSIRAWQLPGGEPVGMLRGHTFYVTALASATEGSRIVSGGEDTTVRTWNAGKLSAIGPGWMRGQALPRLAVSTDGSVAAAVSPDPEAGGGHWCLRVWARDGGITSTPVSRVFPMVASSRDSLLADPGAPTVIGPQGRLELTGGPVATSICRTDQAILSVRGDRIQGFDPVTLTERPELQRALPFHGGLIAATPDGGTVVVVEQRSPEAKLQLFRATGESWQTRIDQPNITGLGILPDGRTVLTCSCDTRPDVWPRDWTLSGWDVRTGARVFRLPDPAVAGPPAHTRELWSLDVTPDGRWAVTASDDHRVVLWDLAVRRPQAGITLDGVVLGAAVSADGRTVAAVDENYAFHIFDVQ